MPETIYFWVNFLWYYEGDLVTTDYLVQPGLEGMYSAVVDFSGCSNESDPFLYTIMGIDEAPGTIGFYPNPATNTVTVDFENAVSISFTDVLGRKQLVTTEENIDVSHLLRGYYVVEIATKNGIIRNRILLK